MSSRILNVPYKSQNDPDALRKNNDCGPACVAMLLLTQGQDVRTDDVYAASGVTGDRPLRFDQVEASAAAHGLTLTSRVGLARQDLCNYIDQGTPVIALIKYEYLPDRQGQGTTGGHFVLVVGYDDDAGEIVINDPYYWGDLRSKGDHHHYDYNTWEQAWGRCNEDGNPNHALMIPQLAQPAPALPDYTQTLPPAGTVFVLPAADQYGGLKLRPVRDTSLAGQVVFSGRPLTVVQGLVAGPGDTTWVLVRTQTAGDMAGWACAQSGGEAYIGDRPGATMATTISLITPAAREAFVWPDADKYGGLKLRPARDANLSGPALSSGAELNVVADPVGSGDHEWWLVVAQDGSDTAGWAHVRQAGEVYVSETHPSTAPVAFAPSEEVDVWVVATDGLLLRLQRDVPAGPGSPVVFYKQHLTALGPESDVDAKGRTWRQIRTGEGLVAWAPASENGERYLGDTPPGAAPAAPVAAVAPGVEVRPFGKCLTGVGMANPQLLLPEELTMVATSRVEAFKVLTLPDPDENKQLVKSLYNAQKGLFIVARLFFQIDLDNKPRFSPQIFVETTLNGMNALYEAGVRYFEIHTEPNHPNEGMGWNWNSGAEFGQWFVQVMDILRQRFPDVKYGFPGLSPQPNVPDFLDGATPFIARADWVGIHCYWQTLDQPPYPMIADNAGMYWRGFRSRFPSKLLMITEFSNNSAGVDPAEKGRQYARYFQLLRNEPNMGAAFAFALNWPGQDGNHEGWIYEGQVTTIPSVLGARVGEPGFLA